VSRELREGRRPIAITPAPDVAEKGRSPVAITPIPSKEDRGRQPVVITPVTPSTQPANPGTSDGTSKTDNSKTKK
jgi:hypothetical protein